MNNLFAIFALATSLALSYSLGRADWPEHRGNPQRSGFHEQELKSRHWVPLWKFTQLSAPQPAWPQPAKGSLWQKLDTLHARVTDDRADVPLIVNDATGRTHVLITSSANDRLLSLDPETGKVQWQFVTRAPVRYAPSIFNGIAYLGADDGLVRAIDIANGQLVWQTRIGPEMPWVVGNDRLVSSHPIRTSVLVHKGKVFATAGLFPSQGVYAVGLDVASGEPLWRRKIPQSPQGYLLADSDKLYIPTGRSKPFALKQIDGRFMFELESPGGTFCILTPDAILSGPGNRSVIEGQPSQPGAKMLSYPGKQFAAGNGLIWSASGTELVAHRTQTASKPEAATAWSVNCPLHHSLIVSGMGEDQLLFVAGGQHLQYHAANTGQLRGQLSLDNPNLEIQYMAVSPVGKHDSEILVATTASGEVFAWRGSDSPKPQEWQHAELPRNPPTAARAPTTRHPKVRDALKSPRGWALVLGDKDGSLVRDLLTTTELRMISLHTDASAVTQLQNVLLQEGTYGHRVTVWQHEQGKPLPFSHGIFNAVVEATTTKHNTNELLALASPETGFVWRAHAESPTYPAAIEGAGVWRHQYANPANTSATDDKSVGTATAFRLLWFGGVGPNRIPDRHLRGPAPLTAGGATVVQGDGVLIGIDPANGTERWELKLPAFAMRYVTPFDCGYACLSRDGNSLFVAANHEIWQVDSYTGQVIHRTPIQTKGSRWGYIAESNGNVIASVMKHSAPRTAIDKETRYSYVESDYHSERPLVTSRELHSLTSDGTPRWSFRSKGVIVNGTIALNAKRIVFLESRSEQCLQHATDRIPAPTLLEDAYLISISPQTGDLHWEVPLKWRSSQNMLFAQLVDQKIILTTSESRDDKAHYMLKVINAQDGSPQWQAEHGHVKNGLFHGEQVHHPVALKQADGKFLLIAEPFLYDLETGTRIGPGNQSADWALNRPGHSCGTLSGAGNCLFFRAGNPTVLNLDTSTFTALAPTRAGCWINMIPAGGRLLIPEGSSSCVCHYSLQTSMAFTPLSEASGIANIPVLPDQYPPVLPQPAKSIYAWDFSQQSATARTVTPATGSVKLHALEDLTFSRDGLNLNGTQWLSNNLKYPRLPAMPETITLEAWVKVDESPEWAGVVGAVQDNGRYERGCMLGIHNNRFFFSLASSQRNNLTYLESPSLLTKQKLTHLVGTYDGNLMRLYVDGKQVAESTQQKGGLYIDRNSWLTVGAYKDNDELYRFRGNIKSVTIYDGVLDEASIRSRR
ncbi:MAG: hypothetical protein CMM01_24610 [Rhodopirellula sp.]|nr:hypothetical protein [Rhodopirellula sp.]